MTSGHDPYSGRRFRRAFQAFVVGRSAQAIATLGLTLLTVRWLAPGQYGAYMLMWGAIELAVPLTSLGLLPAIQQFLPRLAREGTVTGLRRFARRIQVARYALILSVGFAAAYFWPHCATWLGLNANDHPTGLVFCAVAVTVLAGRFAAEVLEALLEQADAQRARAVQPVLRLAGLIALWATDRVDLLSLLLVDLAASIASWAAAECWMQQRIRALQPRGTTSVTLPQVIRFVWQMSLAQLLQAVGSAGALRLMVGRVLGVEVAGVFGFMQQLVIIANRYLPSVLLANMVRPMLIAQHSAGRQDDAAVGFGLLWKLNLLLALSLAAVVVVGGDFMIELASGGLVLDAGLPMALLTLSVMSTAQSQVVAMALQVYGYTGNLLLVSLLSPLALPMVMWGGQTAGLVGAAAATALATGLRSSISLALLQRRDYRMRLDWSGALRLLGLLILLTLAALALSHWAGQSIAVGALVVCLAALLRPMRPLSPAEGALVARAAGRRASWFAGWSQRP